jgi:hypothetical protein
MLMKKYQIAFLGDCQNVALESPDWSILPYFTTILPIQMP